MQKKSILKKIFIYTVSAILLCILYVAMHLGYNFFSDNIHTVIPNKIYRSAQLNKKNLTELTEKYHIKSMINLRGTWPTNHWYEVEKKFAKINHIEYYPIQFSAYKLPKKQEIRILVHILQIAPKPLVFHCEGGADRTGMAAAISLILFKKNATIAEIEKEASWHYNAVSRFTVGYQVMRNYFAWLKKNNLPQSKENFLTWLNSDEKMQPYEGWFFV
ncbi:MAG: hypothetical protein ACD_29C00406G0002 [uncultured bacterium]|nr:MAG: hypothetical protein ACD_29C00406G0002 [uncultured bacterium]